MKNFLKNSDRSVLMTTDDDMVNGIFILAKKTFIE